MTKSATYTTSLFAIDYLEDADGEKEGAFELAASDRDLASKNAEIELREEYGIEGITVGRATFEEFDSGNVFHGAAYFNVHVEGIDQETLDKILGL